MPMPETFKQLLESNLNDYASINIHELREAAGPSWCLLPSLPILAPLLSISASVVHLLSEFQRQIEKYNFVPI